MSRQTAASRPYSFWLHLVLPRMMILLCLAAAGSLLRLATPLLYGLLLADVGFFVWQFCRFQSSADAHLRSMGSMTPVWGGYLVLLFGLFASAVLWWGAVLFGAQVPEPELFTERMDRQYASRYSLTLSDDATTLHFDGEITFGLTKRARALMRQTPQLTTVTLSSTGGHIYEARGFAYLIRDHQLDTRAVGDCSSACTLVFVAGKQRSLDPGARLGFHSYALEFGSALPNLDLQKEQDKDREFFRSRGITEAFLTRMFDQPSTSLWHPNQSEARQAGLLIP